MVIRYLMKLTKRHKEKIKVRIMTIQQLQYALLEDREGEAATDMQGFDILEWKISARRVSD